MSGDAQPVLASHIHDRRDIFLAHLGRAGLDAERKHCAGGDNLEKFGAIIDGALRRVGKLAWRRGDACPNGSRNFTLVVSG